MIFKIILLFQFLAIYSSSNRDSFLYLESITRNHLNELQLEVYKFKSNNYIKSKGDEHLGSFKEASYHTFNFNNNTVTFRSRFTEWKDITIKFKSYYKEYSDYILVCEHEFIKEIWFNPEYESIEHEYHSGLHYTFTEIN